MALGTQLHPEPSSGRVYNGDAVSGPLVVLYGKKQRSDLKNLGFCLSQGLETSVMLANKGPQCLLDSSEVHYPQFEGEKASLGVTSLGRRAPPLVLSVFLAMPGGLGAVPDGRPHFF